MKRIDSNPAQTRNTIASNARIRGKTLNGGEGILPVIKPITLLTVRKKVTAVTHGDQVDAVFHRNEHAKKSSPNPIRAFEEYRTGISD